jgi:hypothetical protein
MAEQAQVPEGSVQVPTVWVGVEDLPILFTNQTIGVVQRGEVFLTFGALVPPAIIGETVEERKAQAESIQFVQINPVARMAMTPDHLRRLIQVLQDTLSNYERLTEAQE